MAAPVQNDAGALLPPEEAATESDTLQCSHVPREMRSGSQRGAAITAVTLIAAAVCVFFAGATLFPSSWSHDAPSPRSVLDVLPVQLSKRDVARAKKVVPSLLLKAHAGQSNELLNKHLVRISGGRARPCEDFSAEELVGVSKAVDEMVHPELQRIHAANKHSIRGEGWTDPRAGQAVEIDASEFAKLPDEDIQSALAEKLCYETAMAFTHSVPDAQKPALLGLHEIPLLPKSEGNETSARLESKLRELEEVPAGNIKKGRKLFLTRCAQCHTVVSGPWMKRGPPLYGIVGSHAGTRAGYSYSKAMKTSGVMWDKEYLYKWLENPPKSMPGIKQVFAGLKKKNDRADLIAYLESKSP